jgi:hypothetical protein
MFHKRVAGKGYALFSSFGHKCPSALMIIFRFCWKSMVLSAALMTRTKNKSSVYFQGVTVSMIFHINFEI